MRNKLKRERVRNLRDEGKASPGEPRIELCRPTPEQPALRRYVPAEATRDPSALQKAGILDWRDDLPGKRLEDLSEVADHILLGDSAKVLSALPRACVSCVITSPPYWNAVDYGYPGQLGTGSYEEYLEELLAVWKECERVLAPNGKLCINTPILPIPKKVMPHQHTRHLKNLCNDIEATILHGTGLERYSLYIWQKQTTEKMFGSYPFPPNLLEQNTCEFINVFVKAGRPRVLPQAVKEPSRLTESQWMNLTRQVWSLYPADVKRAQHPAPFPESLPNRLVAMYTFAACPEEGFPGDLVLDPFCGTGATCAAARKLSRRYLGIDLSEDFALKAAERCAQAQPDSTVFLCP
ncbi:MAG: site-specific DNA-methyltransferase [Armatimonadia bacterium]